MNLLIECSRSGEEAILDLEGRLDSASASQLSRRVAGLVLAGCSDIWLSFQSVTVVDEAGIEALGSMEANLTPETTLRIACPSGSLRSQLTLAGLEHLVSSGDPGAYDLDLFGIAASVGGA